MTKPLSPCPFCNGQAEIVEAAEEGECAYVVACLNRLCQASSAVMFPLMDNIDQQLTERWNRRVVDADAHYEAGFREAIGMAARTAAHHDPQHPMNRPISDRIRENIARDIRAIAIPDAGHQ